MQSVIQTDETIIRLREYAIAQATQGDIVRAEITVSMIELYVQGRIDITFSEQGEPTAHLIEHLAPLVASPLFGALPSLFDASPTAEEVTNKRPIGFRTHN